MPSQGTLDKKFVTSIQLMDAREIRGKIIDQARDREFVNIMRLIGRFEKSTESVYHNHVNEDTNVVGVINGAPTGAGTTSMTVVLTAGSSGVWTRGDVVRVNGKNALVYSVSTNAGTGVDTLVLKSLTAGNITAVSTDKLYWQGKAVAEGAKPGNGVRYKTTPYSNKIQIVEVYGVPITDIQSMSKVEIEGEGIYGYQRDQEMILVKKAISGALLAGQGSTTQFGDGTPVLVDADGKPIQTTSGLDEQVSLYGGIDVSSLGGVVTAATIAAREDAMLAVKAPKDFMVIGSTKALRPYSNYLKNLGSGGVTSVQMHIDGRSVDLLVDQYVSSSSFRYDLTQIDTLDDPAMYPAIAGEIGGCLYYIPKDNVALAGGGSAKRFISKYQEQIYLPKQGGANVRWEQMIKETNWGGLAPNATDGENVMNTKWTAYVGLELLGVRHFYKEKML